ncbi:hypothetical protein KC19_1G195700 [Ceratodon purpureus]|uniref:Secreted protein n=1 Tax=Ceratodon purpureus TaxID=3225 RepID=A0A8T0J731_CERPU|nr:hypothetical protein KC19_1G195700 [Ceratodon purpureus]
MLSFATILVVTVLLPHMGALVSSSRLPSLTPFPHPSLPPTTFIIVTHSPVTIATPGQ